MDNFLKSARKRFADATFSHFPCSCLEVFMSDMSSILNYFKKRKRNNDDEIEISCEDSQSEVSGAVSVEADDSLSVEGETPTEIAVASTSRSLSQQVFFDNKISPSQPRLDVYPTTSFGKKDRRFNPSWYGKYNWLEYNIEKDAAFCFACRVFPSKHVESTFNSTGFRDWKNATDKCKGLTRHNSSEGHQKAMENWSNYVERSSKSVEQSFQKVSNDQEKWLFAVFNVTRFLCANGLPFRGSDEADISGDGLFLRAFSQLIFPLEPSWEKIHRLLPGNAKYTSASMQNEIISVLAELVRRKIAARVREAKLYTILADGTTDKNRVEIQGLVIRFMYTDGTMKEHCLDIKGIEDRSAQGILSFIESTLKKRQISLGGIVSQSYDGASVMSGVHSGLQARMNEICGRTVLYVHCFLHKISLVVVEVMKSIEEISDYFSTSASLYNFFKKAAVAACYDGSSLKRLIATRWSGHYDSVLHVSNNYSDITHALALAARSRQLNSEDKALALGLLSQTSNDQFLFLNCMLLKVLKPINIIVKQLQSSTENIVSALTVINSVREDLVMMRDELDEEVCTGMMENFKRSEDSASLVARGRRNTQAPQHFHDFIISEHLPSENRPRSNLEIYAETLDVLLFEFDRRFSSNNTSLWKAMQALSPTSNTFMDFDTLKPLYDYSATIPAVKDQLLSSNASLIDLEAECRIFKRVLKDVEWPKLDHRIDLVAVSTHVKTHHHDTAPLLATLYNVAITAGWTSARCECVFSTLSKIAAPQRRSMKTTRECDLAYLSYESNVLMKDITFDEFFSEWNSKPRKL